MTKEIYGVAFAWAETGTEGFIWAVQDEKHIKHEGPGGWSYDGLNCLENGDYLEIYDEQGKILFSGEINFMYFPKTFPYPIANGKEIRAYCHTKQIGVSIRKWSSFFLKKYKCKLIKKK